VGEGEIGGKERMAMLKRVREKDRKRKRGQTKRMRESRGYTVNVGHFESQASPSPVPKVSFRPRVL